VLDRTLVCLCLSFLPPLTSRIGKVVLLKIVDIVRLVNRLNVQLVLCTKTIPSIYKSKLSFFINRTVALILYSSFPDGKDCSHIRFGVLEIFIATICFLKDVFLISCFCSDALISSVKFCFSYVALNHLVQCVCCKSCDCDSATSLSFTLFAHSARYLNERIDFSGDGMQF